MGVRRKRRRREEQLEEEEQGRDPAQEQAEEKERPREREATPADRVLELQKTAGNRATTAALARWGIGMLPLAAVPRWPKEPQVIVDGLVIPLHSFSFNEASSGTGSTGQGKTHLNDIQVMTTLGDHSAELAQRTARGNPFKTVVIVVPGKDGKGMTLTLTDVMISRYSISGDAESWSLSFAKKEFSQSPPMVQPRP